MCVDLDCSSHADIHAQNTKTAGGERMGEGGIPEVLDDIMALDTELFLWCVRACVPFRPMHVGELFVFVRRD